MDNKRKRPASPGPSSRSKKSNGTSSNSNPIRMNKESFLRSLKNIKLYVEGDRYYEQAKINKGPLVLKWN